MATPPFLPDESKPADADIVSQYPAVERTFRDIMETWLLVDHDTAGEHAQVTLPERGSDPSQATNTGFVYTKDDSGDTELYYEDDSGNVVQVTLNGALNAGGFPANTSLLFYQSLAPTGWTKDVASTLGNHAIRVMTDVAWSAGTKGNTAFDSVFGAGKSSADVTLTGGQSGTSAHLHGAGTYSAANGGAHGHGMDLSSGSTGVFNAGEHLSTVASAWAAGTGGGTNVEVGIVNVSNHSHSLSGSSSTTAEANADDVHSHTLSLDLNYINVIRATKN